jgi:LacI family transcriptional regulator, galactose operon repressor
MSTPRITIYEVAERAQVSISTVSNALNRPERVSAATRERVLAVADELGFVPKAQAVHLARRGTGRIGIMAPFTAYASYFRRLSGVLSTAADLDLEVVLFDHESAALATSPVLASMPIHGRMDGLIVMGLEIEDGIAERLARRGMPTVAVDARTGRFSSVVIDDVEGGRIAARHLVERGYASFGYVVEHQVADYESQAVLRRRGFDEVVRTAGLGGLTVVDSENSVGGARAAARQLLESADRPRAVMAHHDVLAVGVLLAARDLGLRVPEDLAIMGFDDGEVAEAADLTTVRQPFEQSGAVALRLLLALIAGSQVRESTSLAVELIPRATT